MIISPKEQERAVTARLEIYRMAVQHGFYNEFPETKLYKGYHIVQEGTSWLVMQNGVQLMSLREEFVARVWVTCRVNSCGLVEANRIVKAEKSGTN